MDEDSSGLIKHPHFLGFVLLDSANLRQRKCSDTCVFLDSALLDSLVLCLRHGYSCNPWIQSAHNDAFDEIVGLRVHAEPCELGWTTGKTELSESGEKVLAEGSDVANRRGADEILQRSELATFRFVNS